MTQTATAVGATLVALAFALSTFERWLARRGPHELAWTIALGCFTVGAGALAAGAANGWSGPGFRVFYLFGAVVNVPVLGVGTVYLLADRRTAHRVALGVALAVSFAVGVMVAAPLVHPVPPDRLPKGSEVFGPLPRVLAAVASGGGALVVLGGALWSAWRHRRGRLVWANGLIAAGTLVTGASGLLNSVAGEMEAFALTLALGIAIIFAGFLVAVAPAPAVSAAPAAGPSPPGPAGAPARS